MCVVRSVESIGDYAFAYCDRLTSVAILPTAIDIGKSAFFGDSSLIQIDATAETCSKVLDSCSGTCTAFQNCSNRDPASAPAASGGFSPGVIAAIVISAVVGAVLVVVLLLWRWKLPSQPAEYDAVVQGIEIHPVPPEDGSIEASEGPQAEELRMSDDQASPDSAAPAHVVPAGGGDEAVAVSRHAVVGIEHLMIIEAL